MKAYEIIERYGWTKGVFARNKNGEQVPVCSTDAQSFCLLGLLLKKHNLRFEPNSLVWVHRGYIIDRDVIHERIGCIVEWNDAPDRKREDVAALLKELDI